MLVLCHAQFGLQGNTKTRSSLYASSMFISTTITVHVISPTGSKGRNCIQSGRHLKICLECSVTSVTPQWELWVMPHFGNAHRPIPDDYFLYICRVNKAVSRNLCNPLIRPMGASSEISVVMVTKTKTWLEDKRKNRDVSVAGNKSAACEQLQNSLVHLWSCGIFSLQIKYTELIIIN